MSDSIMSNNVKKKLTKKKKPKGETSDMEPDTESSEEELDLTKDCHPIGHYINDRAEMINQMFSVIKGKKLKAMLPPILRDYDLEKLKLECLDQLLGMSEKRIQCILDGENLDTSSESEIPSDDSEDSKDSSESASSSEPNDARKTNNKRKHSKRKSDTESEGRASKVFRTKEDAPAPDTGKTLLEILELEMRARAIRALLKQGAAETVEGVVSEPMDTGGDIVDLTADDDEFPRVIKTEPGTTEHEQTFEEKVEKNAVKPKVDEEEKKKKLIAETEIRNRLKKKKTYRTRQQRMANEEEPENHKGEEQTSREEETANNVEVKTEEPKEPTEIVIEDPEDGEVSSEDEPEPPVVVKEEKPESPEPDIPTETTEKVMDGERITAIDDGNFVANVNVEFEEGHDDGEIKFLEEGVTEKRVEEIELVDDEHTADLSQDTNEGDAADVSQDATEERAAAAQDSNFQNNEIDEISETSWRERWYSKEDVQKVVKSSKICTKVKKRIASKKKEKEVKSASPVVDTVESVPEKPIAVVEGSVSEYEQLLKNSLKDNISTGITAGSGKDNQAENTPTEESNKEDT